MQVRLLALNLDVKRQPLHYWLEETPPVPPQKPVLEDPRVEAPHLPQEQRSGETPDLEPTRDGDRPEVERQLAAGPLLRTRL